MMEQAERVNGMTLDELLSRPTAPVPAWGKEVYGLARNGSYEAARKGDIATLKVGRRILVNVAAEAKKLGLETTFGRAA